MLIHASGVAAVHAHPAGAVTAIEADPPALSCVSAVGLIEIVHVGLVGDLSAQAMAPIRPAPASAAAAPNNNRDDILHLLDLSISKRPASLRPSSATAFGLQGFVQDFTEMRATETAAAATVDAVDGPQARREPPRSPESRQTTPPIGAYWTLAHDDLMRCVLAGRDLDFTPPPAAIVVMILVITVLYVAATGLLKAAFHHRDGPMLSRMPHVRWRVS
jgi:hypothetical protein